MADTQDDNSAARIDRTEAYAAKIQRQFSATVNAILKLHKSIPKLEEGQMYSFDAQSKRIRREADKLLRELNSVVQLAIKKGIEVEWDKAEEASKALLQKTIGKDAATQALKLTTDAARNAQAMQQFIARSDNGMNLSGRVWQTCQQLRDEMEVALTVAIGEGGDAGTISRKVRKYLNDPDLMFRRFRYKDADGNWQRKWKKKVIVNGKTKWIDYDRDSYKTGPGVYKSAARNAMRVARTETNMAYRRSDNSRWAEQDFVIGQRISLSKSHPAKPEHELCEKLAGDYPKDFVFEGWHPQCFCVLTPIFVPESEQDAWSEAIAKGEEYKFKTKPISDYPSGFKEWVTKNRDSILAKRQAGTENYFTKHNKGIIDNLLGLKTTNAKQKPTIQERADARHAARTPEQVEAIQKAWDKRQKQHKQILDEANKTLKTAKDYNEVEYTQLETAIKSGNIQAISAQSKTVAAAVSEMTAKETALGNIIPDAHEWHKKFSLADLQTVYNAVETKLASWQNLDIASRAEKMRFEAVDYLGGNMRGVQTKYATWEVSQKAYYKALRDIMPEYDKIVIKHAYDATHKDYQGYEFQRHEKCVLAIMEENYLTQKSNLTKAQITKGKADSVAYTSKKAYNPHYIFGCEIGGVYPSAHDLYPAFLQKYKGKFTEGELSIIARFTNGSTFSNAWHLNKTSQYWKSEYDSKVSYLSKAELTEVTETINQWTNAANYVLDKMPRYPSVTFRGMRPNSGTDEILKQLTDAYNSGKPWVNIASCSTSSRYEVAHKFDGGALLVIYNKTGAWIDPISDYHQSEFEVMTLAGTKYRVLTLPTKVNGRYVIELEEI